MTSPLAGDWHPDPQHVGTVHPGTEPDCHLCHEPAFKPFSRGAS